jgi:hypothetical protein
MAQLKFELKSPFIPLFQSEIFLFRTLTPSLEKRGRGDYWRDSDGNYVANF